MLKNDKSYEKIIVVPIGFLNGVEYEQLRK